jgi:hypothetical protein
MTQFGVAESFLSRGGTDPSSRRRGGPISKHAKIWKERNIVTGPDRARNQEGLCWRGPAAIYLTDRVGM